MEELTNSEILTKYNLWKNLPYDIQTKILLNFDKMSIIILYENNIKFSDKLFDLYLKQDYIINNSEYHYFTLNKMIEWIKKDRYDIFELFYIKFNENKYKNILFSLSLLYGNESFINKLINNKIVELFVDYKYSMVKTYKYYGLEMICFKLRNMIYFDNRSILLKIIDNLFYNNHLLTNIFINYVSYKPLNFKYFNLIDKSYKELIKIESHIYSYKYIGKNDDYD